jgi:pyruvate dehydrogenase E1 component beta subunit
VRAPEHHSDSVEALLAHMPGLRVVIPSSPRQAYGLLLAAIRDPDPVVFLEPTRLYRAFREEVEDDGMAAALDRSIVTDEGADLTLVAWGAMHADVRAAREELSERGISAEVIDVATLKPFDADTLLASVEKTGRCVIVHEAARTCGFGAEIAAILSERAFAALLAPVERVTGYDTVVPMPRLEKAYFPDRRRIIEACERVMRYG